MISMQENMSARTLTLSSSAQRTIVRFVKLPLVDKIPLHTAWISLEKLLGEDHLRYSATTPRAKVLKEVRNVAVMISMEKGAMARGSGHHQHGGHRHDG
uniref:Uncharacterized protein n=1 Tax=Zea mays TaxID=4577 RepID=A0A804PD40_MAIZE